MATVSLSEQEWAQVVALLANNCVWSQVNPLLMKIGQQLEAQRREMQTGLGGQRPNSESSEEDLDRRSRQS